MTTCDQCPLWKYLSGDTGKCTSEDSLRCGRLIMPYGCDPACQTGKLLIYMLRWKKRALIAEGKVKK